MIADLAVVTPWWGHEDLAPDYFGAMVLGNPEQLVIVDNASEPALNFATIRADTNLGFAGGSNYGLEHVTTSRVLFVNNDVYTGEREWLLRIADAMEPGVLVGTALRYDRHGDVDGISLPYLDGWCIGGMTSEIRELGGFDTEYNEPAYYSDNDLCLRARARGMTLREVKAGLLHRGSVTAEKSDGNPIMQQLLVHNYTRYASKVREVFGEAA